MSATAKTRMGAAEIEQQVNDALLRLRAAMAPADGSPVDVDLATLECFAQFTYRLIRKTNASKVRDCAAALEIKARMDMAGVPEVRT